jgi:hypothetical protein
LQRSQARSDGARVDGLTAPVSTVSSESLGSDSRQGQQFRSHSASYPMGEADHTAISSVKVHNAKELPPRSDAVTANGLQTVSNFKIGN